MRIICLFFLTISTCLSGYVYDIEPHYPYGDRYLNELDAYYKNPLNEGRMFPDYPTWMSMQEAREEETGNAFWGWLLELFFGIFGSHELSYSVAYEMREQLDSGQLTQDELYDYVARLSGHGLDKGYAREFLAAMEFEMQWRERAWEEIEAEMRK